MDTCVNHGSSVQYSMDRPREYILATLASVICTKRFMMRKITAMSSWVMKKGPNFLLRMSFWNIQSILIWVSAGSPSVKAELDTPPAEIPDRRTFRSFFPPNSTK